MQKIRAMLARALPVALLATLMTLVGSVSAEAVTQAWSAPMTLSDMRGAQNLLPLPNGNVVVSCSYYTSSVAIKTVNASGAGQGDVGWSNNPAPDACDGVTAVAADGTVYTQAASTTTNARYIVAYGVHQWTSELTTSCPNVWNYPSSVVLGYDGNVYAFVGSQGQCPATGSRLMGFDPTTGTVVLNVGLGNTQSGGYNGLQVYNGGLIVWWGNQLRYFDYSGNEQSSVVDISLGSGEMVAALRGGTGGNVLALVVKNQQATSTCPYTQVVSRLLSIHASGQNWSYAVADCQQFQGSFSSMPSNGAVFVTNDGEGNDHVTAVNGSGSTAWLQPYSLDIGNDGVHIFGYYIHASMKADNNGNIVVWQYYHSQDNQRLGIQVNVLDGGNGLRRSVFYTDNLMENMSFNAPSIGLGVGRLYLMVSICSSGSCGGSPSLFAINVPGLSLDFPRAAALGMTPQPSSEQDYVDLGDSFASGQGVPPFETGTDTAGPPENRCHRSSKAFGELLDQDVSANLRLVAFMACSGATTAQLGSTWPSGGPNTNELAQFSVLNSTTKVVTLSIGGNDARFSDFVTQCLMLDCASTAVRQYFSGLVANLNSALTTAYQQALSLAPNAHLYVLGYPMLLPGSGCSGLIDGGMHALNSMVIAAHAGGTAEIAAIYALGHAVGLDNATIQTFIASNGVTFTPDEVTAANDLVTNLNNKIQAMISGINSPRITYVNPLASGSPFIGHDLCSGTPYFNGLDLGHTEYSFHPNALGQDAYRRLLLNAF